MMEYDTIIVGAGSAGCVLANRLTEDPDRRVLLLEAGGRDWHPFIHMPAGLSQLVGAGHLNWNYNTEPERELENRRLYWPRGRVLGGSSSINAMCYCRGHRKDYDEWAESGADGWDFDRVLPYFIKSEDQANGASRYHGAGGPIRVENLRHKNPLSSLFLKAAEQAGHPATDDFNGPHQRGFDFYQVTQRKGRRCSSARGYLKPVLDRPNLHVWTHALAARVVISQGAATGVHVVRKGKAVPVSASEVILSGGAINSPQLLLLSGIGPAEELEPLGIAVHQDLPGVGKNLQDHLDICSLKTCHGNDSYDRINHLSVVLRYLYDQRGPGSSNLAEAGGFIVSQFASDDRPDIQMHFVPALLDDHGRNRLPGNGMTIHACPLRPTSRGEIRLKSSDPDQPPAIHANYLSTGYDRQMMLECVRLSREIFSQDAFAGTGGIEIFPGESVRSDNDLLAFIRRKAETVYHPVGTCKMGGDAMAVVSPGLKVKGIDGLHVVDASVMPSLLSGNTNAPTMMIAEKFAAEHHSS
jgi:choline dehydrogenase